MAVWPQHIAAVSANFNLQHINGCMFELQCMRQGKQVNRHDIKGMQRPLSANLKHAMTLVTVSIRLHTSCWLMRQSGAYRKKSNVFDQYPSMYCSVSYDSNASDNHIWLVKSIKVHADVPWLNKRYRCCFARRHHVAQEILSVQFAKGPQLQA